MNKIGIFCSASENIDKMYFDSARLIGKWLGEPLSTYYEVANTLNELIEKIN